MHLFTQAVWCSLLHKRLVCNSRGLRHYISHSVLAHPADIATPPVLENFIFSKLTSPSLLVQNTKTYDNQCLYFMAMSSNHDYLSVLV